ncbi:hypothetical protein PCASD_15877 [Puccinia coronata f. sp. avenae]|uniref:Uncharacterized protein n=1 Tax=Puccinia coronata f. sp. avenae TaxID=200324 RepID=A0A2N5U7V1_9BASI|nr:hypothetical protein PCASD_15877 [Puccinia coronata f. sp. avenae]
MASSPPGGSPGPSVSPLPAKVTGVTEPVPGPGRENTTTTTDEQTQSKLRSTLRNQSSCFYPSQPPISRQNRLPNSPGAVQQPRVSKSKDSHLINQSHDRFFSLSVQLAVMTGSNSYRPRHSHPINGPSLIPQHVLNSNRNSPSPRLSRPAIDPYKAFTADDLDGFVDSITSKIRNALLGNTSTDSQPKTQTHPRTSDVFGKLESIPTSDRADLAAAPGPSGFRNQSTQHPTDDTAPTEETDYESDDNHDDSIQPKQKTREHIELNSDDDILISSPPSSHAVQNKTSHIDSSSDSNSNDDLIDSDVDPESNNRGSDYSGGRRPASQDLDPRATSFFNNPTSSDPEDIVSIDNSMEESSSVSNSSHFQKTSSEREPAQESSPSEIQDELDTEDSIQADSDSSSIVFQSHPSSSKPPASHHPFQSFDEEESSDDDHGSVHTDDIDEFEDEDEDEENVKSDNDSAFNDRDIDDDDDNDRDLDGDEIEADDQLADIAVNFNGENMEEVEPSKDAKNVIPGELEHGEIEFQGGLGKEGAVELSTRSDTKNLVTNDIMVAEPFIPIHENIQDTHQSSHANVEQLKEHVGQGPADVAKGEVDYSRTDPQSPDKPRGTKAVALAAAELRKLSRTGSFSADGTMMFRPSSESSVNLDSDRAPEDGQHSDKAQAAGDLDRLPAKDLHTPNVSAQSQSSSSQLLNRTQPQSPHYPDIRHADLELVHDKQFSPIKPTPELPPGSEEANVRDKSLPQTLPSELQDSNHKLEGSPPVAPPTCDSTAAQSECKGVETSTKELEEQIEDDNDLFEADEDLRLHRLGVDKSRFHKLDQNGKGSSPPINPSNEVEDRFSSIEKQLESYMARTEEPQISSKESQTQQAVCEPPHPSSMCNDSIVTTIQSVVIDTVAQQPLRTDSQVVDHSTQSTVVQDAHMHEPSTKIEQEGAAVLQAEDTPMDTVEEAQSRVLPTDADDTVRPTLDVPWGQLSEGLSEVTQEVTMNQVNFFPLKQSDSEIFNSASWKPALSTSVSSAHDHANARLCSSTEMNCSVISLSLPQRCNVRQTLNFEEDPESIVEAPRGSRDEMNVPSKNGFPQFSSGHDQEDYDMLASSLADGNSDINIEDSKKDIDKTINTKDTEVVLGDSSMLSRVEKTDPDMLQDEKYVLSTPSIHLDTDTSPLTQSAQPVPFPSTHPTGSPSIPTASNDLMEESDILLSQFINCDPDEADDSNPDIQPAPAPPAPSATVVPAVTFATSPPTEMHSFQRVDDQPAANDTQLNIKLDVEQPFSAFEPQTPRTSTAGGQRTSSEPSERHFSRGSAFSAPSSVRSSDAASVPASIAPPPPLHNASMGAPTEAVGLSNQMTRRSSIDSSTHAEPPSPSTSTRHRSAPITQEQVNAPGLPHVEAAEIASPPSHGLPDPHRSPPLSIHQLIPACLVGVDNPVSRASSVVASPPSPSRSHLLEGSHLSIGTSNQDPSPQFDPRLLLPDPVATPLPVSVPAIKLDDLPNACLSIERHPSINSSAASQAATSPRFEKFSSMVPPTNQAPDALIERNVQAVGEINTPDNNALIEKNVQAVGDINIPDNNTLIEKNVQAVGKINTSDNKVAPASTTRGTIPKNQDRVSGSVSPRSNKAPETDQRSEPPPETLISRKDSQLSQTSSTEQRGDTEQEKMILPDPGPHLSTNIAAASSDKASSSIQGPVKPSEVQQDPISEETAAPQLDVHTDPAPNDVENPPMEVEQDLPAIGDAKPATAVERDTLDQGDVDPAPNNKQPPINDEVRDPLQVTEPPETPSQLGPLTRNKRKRFSTPKTVTGTTDSPVISPEEQKKLDHESQLREILQKRRAFKQRTPQTVPQPKQTKKQQINQSSPTAEAKKKKNVIKRDVDHSPGEANLEGEAESHVPSDATEVESKVPHVRSRLPRAAKKSSLAPNSLAPPAQIPTPYNVPTRSATPLPPPSSPLNINAGDESSNSILNLERDDLSLTVGNRKSSKNSRSTTSPAPPASVVSVMIPQLQPEDMIPKLRLHQHSSKTKLFGHHVDHQALESLQQRGPDDTEPKPIVGARPNRRKYSEGTEARALPPSLPPVTRSHCHFIRLQFPKDVDRRFDTFLVPQCATGDEEIKKKMKVLEMIEDDNLTGEEQSRGIRIGPDGHKHSDARLEYPSLLTLKPEHSTFAVDDETLNILIDVFGLSLIQDGQVEVLLPKSYFTKFDDDEDDDYQQDLLRELERGRELSSCSFSSRNEPPPPHVSGGTASTSRNNTHNRLKRRAHSPSSSLHSRASSPRSSSFLSPTEPKVHKRRKSNQLEEI